MDTRAATATRVVRRLWPVAVAGIVLTVAGVVYTSFKVSPSYEAGASILLLSPAVTVDAEGEDVATNPFVLTGPAERVAASSVLAVTESEQWGAAMKAEDAEGDYGYELTEAAPIIDVESAAESPEEALHTLDVATRLFQERFEENQTEAGAPIDRLITTEVLSSTVKPTIVIGSRARAMAAVAVLGLAATATVLFLVDSLAPGWTPSLRASHVGSLFKDKLARLKDKLARPSRHQRSPAAVDDAGG